MGKRRGNGEIGRVCSSAWRDIKNIFGRNISTGIAFGATGPCAPVRIAIYVIMGIVLLFSGIGFMSWVILGILFILLNFC